MKVIAERVYRPLVKPIIWGIILTAGITLVSSGIFFGAELIVLGIIVAIVAFLGSGYLFILRIRNISNANNDETNPIWVDGETIYCYNGKVILEFPVQDLYYAKGRYKKYVHFYGYFISWGSYNYGKVKIFYDDNGSKQKFIIKNVLEPENAALQLMQYVEDFEKAWDFTDYYQILRVRIDASQQEILDAYNKLKAQKPDDMEQIAEAYSVLSSPKQKAEYDVKYWSVHNE